MKGLAIAGIILVAIVAMFGLFVVAPAITSYNGLVNQSEEVKSYEKQIGVQLQRRMDLIPNMVEIVKGYAAHEQKVFGDIAAARAKMGSAQNTKDKLQANSDLSNALSRLLMVVENYPNLKADTQFTGLRDELAGTENRIAVARKDYNGVAQLYNARIKTFPTTIVANMFGFKAYEYFNADEAAKTAPKVKF